jgi:Ca-activated chloride channel family protein
MCGVALSAWAQLPPPPPAEDFRYKVGVQLVLVPTSVSTPVGTALTDLKQDNFEVLENGRPRPLKVFEKSVALPLRLVLMLDASLSTASELKTEKTAMVRFIQRVLRPQDTAALYEFSGGVRMLADFSGSAKTLDTALKNVKPKAGTALYDAVIEASGKLREQSGRRVVVIISDGNDTTSKADFHAALQAAQEAEVSVFSLIVRPIPGESGRSVRGEHALIQLADLTGGLVFFPARAADMDQFFDKVSDFLRTQYLLGYEPAPPGIRAEFRTIEVRVKGIQDYRIQHRKGYFVEPQP